MLPHYLTHRRKVIVVIDETMLLKKYDRDIRKIVSQYIGRSQLYPKSIYALRDDLMSEAQLAFLTKTRSFQLDDDELDPLQRAMCKNAIESALRVYLWKQFNMGGYTNRRIDFTRSITISDLMGDSGMEIDDVVESSYDIDDTPMNVFDFVRRLDSIGKTLLGALMLGYNYKEIGLVMHLSPQAVRIRHKKIQEKYKAYEARISAA